MAEVFAAAAFRAMELITILNCCHRFPGFVYQYACCFWHAGPAAFSWKETAEASRTSWEKVFDAVEHVVNWGLEHGTLGQVDAIGVDEIQYAKGHQDLTLVYQIDVGMTRLLWVGTERTAESFQGFFTTIGQEVASKIVFVCSDMWEPYLKVI